MKVLYITHYPDFMGANRSLLSLILDMRERYQIQILVLLPQKGTFSKELENHNIPFKVIKMYSSFYLKGSVISFFKSIAREFVNLGSALYFSFYIRKRSFDLIHTNSSVITFGAFLKLFTGVSHVWQIREFASEHYKLKYPLGSNFYNLLLNKYSDKVVVISNVLRNKYLEFVPDEKLILIYNGIKQDLFVKNKFEERTVVNIVNIGLIHPSKNQLILLEALECLVNEFYIKNIYIHIIGNTNSPEYLASLENYITVNSLEKYVKFYGYVDNVNEILSNMDIGVLASSYEAFGRVTIEYMMAGVVPVVSNSGANTELVDDNVNGRIFELEDSKRLAIVLKELVVDPDKIREMACAALAFSSNFSSDLVAEKMHKLYKTLKQ